MIEDVIEVTEDPRDYDVPSMPDNNIPYFQETLKINHILYFSERDDERLNVNEPQQFYTLGSIEDDEDDNWEAVALAGNSEFMKLIKVE